MGFYTVLTLIALMTIPLSGLLLLPVLISRMTSLEPIPVKSNDHPQFKRQR